jgi:apolipoprotein N-acyltransferase
VLTNDGWWKGSPGSWQHFGYSRLRAIETRRSIARCANTGISGFINQRGDILKKTELSVSDVIGMPVGLNKTVTFYARYGDYLGKFCVLLSVLIMGRFWLARWRR